MRARVAEVAIPEDECRVGLDHLEGVLALSGLGHLRGWLVSRYEVAIEVAYFDSRVVWVKC